MSLSEVYQAGTPLGSPDLHAFRGPVHVRERHRQVRLRYLLPNLKVSGISSWADAARRLPAAFTSTFGHRPVPVNSPALDPPTEPGEAAADPREGALTYHDGVEVAVIRRSGGTISEWRIARDRCIVVSLDDPNLVFNRRPVARRWRRVST